MPQGELAQVLRGTIQEHDERLLVGPETLDDAGVVLVDEREGMAPGTRLGLVQTVDFFPPVVDDPRAYGEIAAANALSDVYAMGGRPFSALSLAGFPRDFDRDWLREILVGGNAKVAEAGAILAGGHTVESDVQFGFAVTGIVDPDRVLTNAGARDGDIAYLTKPIGMGTMTTAAKLGKISWEDLEPAARQMATLNAGAARAMAKVDAHACTDITGFGLIGHAMNIARASELSFTIQVRDVPLFGDVFALAKRGLFSGGAKRGRDALGADVDLDQGLDETLIGLLFDAETSGGLLIVVSPEDASALEDALTAEGLPVHPIGRFGPSGEHHIRVR